MFVNKDWNCILNSEEDFINFLSSGFNVNWVKKTIINQSNNTITASYENNNLLFSVNSEYNKAMLKLDTCGQIEEFVLLIENNDLRTYKKSEYALNRFISFIKNRDPCNILKGNWRGILWAIQEQNYDKLSENLVGVPKKSYNKPAIKSAINLEVKT